MRKHITSIAMTLVILILASSVFITYKAGEAAGKNILNVHDVVQTFKLRGIIFKSEPLPNSIDSKVEGAEPAIYRDSYGNLLLIYTFNSFKEREEKFDKFEQHKRFSFTLNEINYFPRFFDVKNLQLVYLTAQPSQDNYQAVFRNLQKIDQVIFTNLNAGKEIVFTGQSLSWDGKVSLKYYEHWWTDSENKLLYHESYHTDTRTIRYKGEIPKQPVSMEYSFSRTRGGKMHGTEEVTPEQLKRIIRLGGGGGNGLFPGENDAYKVKITLDGKTEEFELKSETKPDRSSGEMPKR